MIAEQGKSSYLHTRSNSNYDGSLHARVFPGGDDRFLRLWEYDSGDCIAQARWHADTVRCVCFSPDGSVLVSGGDSGVIHFWQISEQLHLQNTAVES